MALFFRTVWTVLSVALLVAVVVGGSVQAATVSSANDYPSTLEAGEDADHTVIFTTPSGATATDTIELEFSSAFDTSSLTEDDIDIEDDGLDLSTSAVCGAADVAVSIAADTVIITLCAGTTIAAASEVTVEIGTNATSSGTGTNQITNPSSPGTYFVSIYGSFGDFGSIALPIVSDGTVSITTEVDQDTGGGGSSPGGGGCTDSTAPTISNIIVSGLTGTTATISWNTNENADGRLSYGETVSYEIGEEYESSLTTSHSVDLTGLEEGVTYHFEIEATDLCGNAGFSGDQTFTTPDNTACVISDVSVVDITDESARVTFTTNEPATSEVAYGLTDAYGSTAINDTLEESHSIILTELAEGTTYHYQVSCEDASGNEGTTSDATFSTLADPPPANVSALSAVPQETRCDLSWTNPADEDLAGIRVVACEDELPSGPDDTEDCEILSESIATSRAHTGLSSETTYYYGVFAYDASGQFASGALTSCTTSAPEVEPEPDPEPEPEPDPEPDPEPEPDPGPDPSGGPFCGDGVCASFESTESCPADCPAEGPVCGDASCDEGEDSDSCPSDCPVIEPPPTTAPPIDADQVEFFVANLAIQLIPTSDGEMTLLGGRTLRAQLLASQVTGDVDRVWLNIGGSTYLMPPNFSEDADFSAAALGDDAYVTDVMTPTSPANYPVTVTIDYADGSAQTLEYVTEILPDGYVFEQLDGGMSRVPSATVTLFEGEPPVVWDGSPYRQFNPATTSQNGTFAWYVENGLYRVQTEKVGYESFELGPFAVENNIVNPMIELTALEVIPEEPQDEPEEPLVPEEPAREPVQQVQEAAGQAVEAVTETLEVVRELPGAQEAAEISTPALAVTAVATTATLATSFGLLPFLQYLFTAPILFFWRRRRKGFGVVYNAISKTPIDLAIVRLFQLPADGAGTGRLIRSRVTDKGGRYFFLVQPGVYRIAAIKPQFTFPSDYLGGKKEDGKYLDVYHGEAIEVTEKDAVITANIPMDPAQEGDAAVPVKVKQQAVLRRIQQVVAISGIIASIVFAAINPTAFTIGMVAVQVVVYLLVRRLAAPEKPKSWGIVYDKATGRPLSDVVVRVFEPKYNKLLATRVTDAKGRYTFLLGPNEYYSVYEKAGFEGEEVRPIDLSKNDEPIDLDLNVSLYPEGTKPAQPESSTTPAPQTEDQEDNAENPQ